MILKPTPAPEIDKSALNKIKTGNAESFEKMLFVYEKRIFNYIFAIVRQKQEAEDMTQETFLKIYKNRKSINPNLNFKAWVYKIATNTVRDWFRKKGNKLELLIIDDPESGFETIDEDFAYNKLDTSKDIENALNLLKPEYRAVLTLFYWQGFGYDEISGLLSIPINTVKTHLYRAKKSLKTILLGQNL